MLHVLHTRGNGLTIILASMVAAAGCLVTAGCSGGSKNETVDSSVSDADAAADVLPQGQDTATGDTATGVDSVTHGDSADSTSQDAKAEATLTDAGADSAAEVDSEAVPEAVSDVPLEVAPEVTPDALTGPDSQGPECCDDSLPCADGQCVAGFCMPYPEPGVQCVDDSGCPMWNVCQNAGLPEVSCQNGGQVLPVYGTCVPSGPGGTCLLYQPGMFGDCQQGLGYAWLGKACGEVTGCQCEPWCDQVFATQEECEAACAPPICCTEDPNCPLGAVCMNGHCILPAGPGQCWDDTDCASEPGTACTPHPTCPCGSPKPCKIPMCDQPPCPVVFPGTCEEPVSCCKKNDDCGPGLTCAQSEPPILGFNGACMPLPAPGQCWSIEDCAPGENCEVAQPCACGSVGCVPQPGTCLPYPEGCCSSDDECGPGKACSKTGSDLMLNLVVGRCLDAPPAGECYSSQQCGPLEACAGASLVGCWDPPEVNLAGLCKPAAGECCWSPMACPEGYECTGLAAWHPGVCQPNAPPGKCWEGPDCDTSESCIGLSLCPCGGDCGGAPAVMGTCGPPPEGCCSWAHECPEDQVCYEFLPAPACVQIPLPGECWSEEDCAPGMFCQDAVIASCDGSTPWLETKIGTCVPM